LDSLISGVIISSFDIGIMQAGVESMASRIVRRLDDDLVRRLKARAAAHRRSAEAEHRAILEIALRPQVTGRELWDKLAGGEKADLDWQGSLDQAIDAAEFE
jgi:plasmid stability protein